MGTYSAFTNAADNNPEKYSEVKKNAFAVKAKADALSLKIQEMKYNLVMKVDKKVYLGKPVDVMNQETEEPREEYKKENITFSELNDYEKLLPIGYLGVKDSREASGTLFLDKKVKKEKQAAYMLSDEITSYRDFLIDIADSNNVLIENIKEVCDVAPVTKKGGKKVDWEIYNFYDMPSV